MKKPPRTLAAASAALTSGVLAASMLYGAVAPVALAEDDASRDGSAWSKLVARAADGVIAGIETAGPIATVAANEGDTWPTMPKGVAVMPRGTVLNGDFPLIFIPALKKVDRVDVRVRQLSSARPDTAIVFEGTADVGWFTVAKSLTRGAEYAVDVRKPSGDWASVGTFNVSSTGNAGPTASVGSIAVSEVTGAVAWSWNSPALPGPAGGVSVGLNWRSDGSTSQGLPEGWSLAASAGSPWMGLEESPVDVAAVDVPAAPAAARGTNQSLVIGFSYPAQETRLVDHFVVAGRTSTGQWRVLARPGRSFAAADVDVILRGSKARDVRSVRVGAVVEGTTIWGPAATVRTSVVPVATAPAERDIVGSGSGSLATPGDQPSMVRLMAWDGSRLTFVRNPLGVYEQTGGDVAGFSNALTWIRDGEWEFAALDGVVTRFVGGRAQSVVAKGVPLSSLTWSKDGRLASVTNEIGRTLTLRYAGDSACPSWPGFAAVPDGMLCAITYPGERTTQIGYVEAGSAMQIALVKDPGNVGETLGWDDRGRIVSVRSTLVNRVATTDASVAGVVDSVVYDVGGRAATLTAAPGEVDGSSMTTTIDFPSVTDAGLREWVETGSESNAVSVRVRATGGSYDLQRVKTVDPVAFQTLRVTAPFGLDTSVDRDNGSGQMSSAVDPVGRTTTYAYDELGLVTSVEGPVREGSQGAVNSTQYDTARVNGRDKALSGMRAQVYDRDDFGGAVSAEFWDADYTRGGLSHAWSGRGAKFSAQASGVWTPSAADDAAGAREGWDFVVAASGGADVSFVIGGVLCAVSSTVCHVGPLPKGPKSVTVQVADAPSDGWFTVSVAPAGDRPKSVPYDDLRPGFGLTTVAASNDDLPGGSDVTRTEYSYADPAQSQLTRVKSPGGLVTDLTYETTTEGNGSWGRLLTRGTPGGLTQATAYWPDRATVQLPTECGGSVDVSGQPKTVTRQDGTSVTTYFDINGGVRAVVSAGGAITHTACTTLRADGSVQSAATFINGALAESAMFEQAVGGDPRVARTTITHGPASSTSVGESRSTTSTIDLVGRVVSATDLAGTMTQTSYDAAGNVSRTIVTPPEGARAAVQRFDYAYDPQSTLLASTSVNGITATTITRDPDSGLITSIDYADAARVAWGYAPGGRVDTVTVTTDNPSFERINDEVATTSAGRITTRSTDVVGTRASSIDVGYAYDSAGHLDRATYTGSASARFEYGHGSVQDASCGKAYPGAGLDGQRTGGSRDGASYVSCYDEAGRQVSTTDPMIAGANGTAELTYDGLGRVTRISGPRALAAEWAAGTQLARLDEIAADGSGLVSTRWDSFGGQVLDKALVTDSGTATVRYAGVFVLDVQDGDVAGTSAIQYSLPGGASVTTAPGASGTLTIPGVDGAALIRLDVPTLGSGTGTAPGAAPQLVGAYGPYGEPLTTPDIAGVTPVPTLGWQAVSGNETLPGTSSIVMMGERPYHPGLGAFLAADPLVDSGDNLYSYTGGDPVNAHDSSGREEDVPMIATAVIGAVTLLATFGTSYLLGRSIARGTASITKSLKAITYVGVAVSAVAAGGATYLAVKGQNADWAIAIGAAAGAAAVATVGGALFAKWGVSRTQRLMNARIKSLGVREVFKRVEAGSIHPAVAPVAADIMAGIPVMSPMETLTQANLVIAGAEKSSRNLWAKGMRNIARQQKMQIKAIKESALDAIDEVSEVASQL